jgi:hypothetical protein
LAIGLYFLLVAVAVGLIPSMYFLIPLILGLLVILLTVQVFRLFQGTVYVITNRRAIKVFPGSWMCKKSLVNAFPPFQPYHVFRRDYPNGTGDAIFATRWISNVDFGGFVPFDDGFFGVPNAKDIEKTLKNLAQHTNAH